MKTYEISPKSSCCESLNELNNAKIYSSNISNYDTFQETNGVFPVKNYSNAKYTYETSPLRQQKQTPSNYYASRSAIVNKEAKRKIKQPAQLLNKIRHDYRDNDNEIDHPPKMVKTLLRDNEELLAQRDSAVNKMRKLKESNDALNQSQGDIEYQCEVQTNKLDVANAHVNELKNQLNISQKQYEDATFHIRDLDEEINKLRKSLTDANVQIKHFECESNDLYNDNRILQEEVNKRNDIISHLQREKKDMFNDLSSQLDRQQKEKDIEIKGYIQDLKTLENQKQALNAKVNELSNELDNQKLINLQKDKLIPTQKEKDATDYLFNFYSTIRDLLLKQTANKEKTFDNPDELRRILNLLEDKIRSSHSNMIERTGKCFACDIACCCSSNERRKFFLKPNNFKK